MRYAADFISALGHAEDLRCANETWRAVIEAAVEAKGAVRVPKVDKAVAVVV